jgi:hypothetical protein
MPRACKEKTEAVVFKKMWEKKHIEQEPFEVELTLKPDISKSQKYRPAKKFKKSQYSDF